MFMDEACRERLMQPQPLAFGAVRPRIDPVYMAFMDKNRTWLLAGYSSEERGGNGVLWSTWVEIAVWL